MSFNPNLPTKVVPFVKPDPVPGNNALVQKRVTEWVPTTRQFFPYNHTCVCGREVPRDDIVDGFLRPAHWVIGRTYCLHAAGYR